MASGRTHAIITKSLAVGSGVAVFVATADINTALLVAMGCFIGLYVEPDLDIATRTYSEKQLLKLWKPLGVLWITIWTPYGQTITHRSIWSHMPILGTFLRVLYLMTPILLVAAVFGRSEAILAAVGSAEFQLMCLGLTIADIGHYIADVVWSGFRKKRKR